MPISYAKRTHCNGCGVPSIRKPNRTCRYCGTKACNDCLKKCCPKAIENKKKADERDFKHFAAYFLSWAERNAVRVYPEVEKTPEGAQRTVKWVAEYVVAEPKYPPRRAEATSLLQALRDLGDGKETRLDLGVKDSDLTVT